MRISVGPGVYVVAVSGGVDSMALLHMLQQQPGLKLTVAHYDHGIRPASEKDRKLVESVAKKYGLPFVFENGKLGPGTNEAKARAARYKFLEKTRRASGARAVITAHHQDDVLETAIMNLLRGSGRRGLTSLRSTDGIVRPLLGHTKAQIYQYARDFTVPWHEDETNQDTSFKRNYIRENVLPQFSPGQRAQLAILLENLSHVNDELDAHIEGMLHIQPALHEIDRRWFISLPHDVAREVVHAWLRKHGVKNVTKKTIERLVTAMKTARVGRKINVDDRFKLDIKRDVLALSVVER